MIDDGLALSWTNYDVVTSSGAFIRTQNSAQKTSYKDVLHKKSVIGCLTAIYDVSLLGKRYMEDIPMRQDFCLWLNIIKFCDEQNLKYGGMEEVLAVYRTGGMTKNKISVAAYQWQVYRGTLKLTIRETLTAFASYGINGLANRIPSARKHR